MTRKDYALVAEAIAYEMQYWTGDGKVALQNLADLLGRRFAADNPNFSITKFYNAATVEVAEIH